MSYNGWRNRETWLINVWFGDSWECAADVQGTKEFFEETLDGLPDFVKDFVNDGIIDWENLEEHAEETAAEIAGN